MPNPVPGTSLQNPYSTGKLWTDGSITAQGPNYVSLGGANNALVGTLTTIIAGTNVTVAEGLRITGKLANSLQASTNTLNLNGSGVKSIARAGGSAGKLLLGTTVSAGSILDFVYDGTNWVVMSVV